jgi:NNP family nitrate/nitrite transporter-like MFS transporter
MAHSRWKILHLTWVAFFLTFVVWFNFPPLASTIAASLKLSAEQVRTLLICNVALTIPARIAVGALVDRFGPRRVFTALLLLVAIPCVLCATATHFWQLVLGRLLVSCVGAGFVVGIRLVGEWFDRGQIGLAEGIYGGLGNFGMAAATFGLPLLAVAFGGADGWRWAIALSGAACAAWAFVFYRQVRDAPAGRTFERPARAAALQVCSRRDVVALMLAQVPMVFCMGILAWKLSAAGLLPGPLAYAAYALLAVLLVQQMRNVLRVNLGVWTRRESVPEDQGYAFSQVAVLSLCYAVTFGGELAVESMLPQYLEKTFGLSVAWAGAIGSGFAVASLVARPVGGLLGDRVGRRRVMIVSLAGSVAGYAAIAAVDATWSLAAVAVVVVGTGLFLMAANGAAFCIAPLIRKPLTGQIAGLVGAYGNVGSVAFLTVLSLAGPMAFFVSMAVTGGAALLCCLLLLREPAGGAAAETAPVTSGPGRDEPLWIEAAGVEAA